MAVNDQLKQGDHFPNFLLASVASCIAMPLLQTKYRYTGLNMQTPVLWRNKMQF